MTELINEKTLEEYENFIKNHTKGHFMQSKMWAGVKPDWKWEAVALRDENGKICASVSVLIRKLPYLPYTLMYAGRGPVCDIYNKKHIESLVEGLKDLARKHNTYTLKIDPDVLASDTEFVKIMKEVGFVQAEDSKNFEAIQPKFVFRMDVEGKNEEEMMNFFHSKTRYNIRLATRKGVTTKICGEEMLDVFTHIMMETGLRDGFVTRDKSYFANLLTQMGENARLYMAFLDEKPIAGTLAIYFGDKVWYLYGASSNEYRNVMPNYLLQWEMIKWSLEKGCRIYDFRGVSGDISEDNPLYGLYRFKKGFNGEFTEFCTEFEYIFMPKVNKFVTKGMSEFRNLRRKVYLAKNRKKDTSKPKNLTGNH
ncbi:MAG: peptidoglycan bridge formation glycyltransferase FemA/FemB family protein [Clostridia bacterium]